MRNFTSFITILGICISSFVNAQDKKEINNFDNWSVNLNAGTNLFYGDIRSDGFLPESPEIMPAWGLNIQKQTNPYLSLRGQFLHGKIYGKEESAKFSGEVLSAILGLSINISNLVSPDKAGLRRGSFYFASGIGMNWWNSELETENLSSRSDDHMGVIPVSLGFDFQLNEKFHVNMETALLSFGSDMFDAYKDNDPHDLISYNSIGITYNFNRNNVEDRQEQVVPAEPAVAEHKTDVERAMELLEKYKEQSKQMTAANNTKSIEQQIIEEEVEGDKSWENIEFKVQIFASDQRPNLKKFIRKHNITAEIEEHRTDEWFKYTIGAFPKYWKAKQYRNLLVTRNKLRDAFVVAYRNGERVPLRELMQEQNVQDINLINPDGEVADGVDFRVQILAAKQLRFSVEEFKDKYNIEEETHIQQFGDYYQLVSGSFYEYKDARNFVKELKRKGIPDAFIVAYRYGSRISMSNAFEIKKEILHD